MCIGLFFFLMYAITTIAEDFTIVTKWNAVPSGSKQTVKNLNACENTCVEDCIQFTFNTHSGHCYISNSTSWHGSENDRTISGCYHSKVSGCPLPPPPTPAPPPTPIPPPKPTWKVKDAPNPKKSYCGFKLLSNVIQTEVYHATKEYGAYNHGVMMDFHDNNFLLTWKNSPRDEDSPGQRILYSQSTDGIHWTPTNGKNIMFPNISSNSNNAALFASPTIIINGHRYASATPKQICLFPTPHPEILLLRRVYANGTQQLGNPFWAAKSIPDGFDEASIREGIVPSSKMDSETQLDVATLSNWSQVPCGGNQTLKCEACVNGCDDNQNVFIGGGAEYTHYNIPNSTVEIILHRTKENTFSYTYRENNKNLWSKMETTNMPNDRSNLNAGVLPSGEIFLVHNPCVGGPDKRDPVVLATSIDGYNFNKAVAVMSCHNLSSTSKCGKRISGKSKVTAPSYPQATTVLGPNGALFVTATNNKEDVWVAQVPYSALN